MKTKKLVLAMESLIDNRPWIGFDLDGTIAYYDEWRGIDHIGEPIPSMIETIKNLLKENKRCKIFTARVSHDDETENDKARKVIEAYCLKHIGQVLEVTCKKDFLMILFYDDRAKEVIFNTGIVR